MRIVIVDDQPLVREGLASLLDMEDDIEVVATAVNGREALDAIRTHQPDAVLMDIRMPVMTGIEAVRENRAAGGPPVILLTTFEEEEDMIAGVQAGAAGYLFKNAEVEDIHAALQQVVQGGTVIHPKVTQALAEALSRPRLQPAPLVPLTARELEVLKGIASGVSNKHIARELGIVEGTVKVHISSVLGKLGAANRTDAVRIAREHGLLG